MLNRDDKLFESECIVREVSFDVIADVRANSIIAEIANPEANMDVVKLEKAPKIAVYTPEIQATLGWCSNNRVCSMPRYLMTKFTMMKSSRGNCLCTIGFTSTTKILQVNMGNFGMDFSQAQWYKDQVSEAESNCCPLWVLLRSLSWSSPWQKKIRDFTAGGGFLFLYVFCHRYLWYSPSSRRGWYMRNHVRWRSCWSRHKIVKLDYSKCFAFQNFKIGYWSPYLWIQWEWFRNQT